MYTPQPAACSEDHIRVATEPSQKFCHLKNIRPEITTKLHLDWMNKYSQYKKKRKLLNAILVGVKFIDCKNDFISVALPFNEDLCSEILS